MPMRAGVGSSAVYAVLRPSWRARLKQQDGRDLMMYGYGRLNQTLLETHLVDEIRFSIHPVLAAERAAGGGQTLPLKLLAATPSPNGVVALTYEPSSS